MTRYVGELYLRDSRGLTDPGHTMSSSGCAGDDRAALIRRMADDLLQQFVPLDGTDLGALPPEDRLNRAISLVEDGHWWVVEAARADSMPQAETIEAERMRKAVTGSRVRFHVQPDGLVVEVLGADGEILERHREGNLRADRRKTVAPGVRGAMTYPERLYHAATAALELADAHDLPEAVHDRDREAQPASGTVNLQVRIAHGIREDAPATETTFSLPDREAARVVAGNLARGQIDDPWTPPAEPTVFRHHDAPGHRLVTAIHAVAGPVAA